MCDTGSSGFLYYGFPTALSSVLASLVFFFLNPGFFVTHFHAPISTACRDTLPSNPSFWLEYLQQRPYESDSDDDEFEGYLGTDDGPVIIRGIDSAATRTKSLTLLPVALVR